MSRRLTPLRSLVCAAAFVILGGCENPSEPGPEPPAVVPPVDLTPPVVSISEPAADALIVDLDVPIHVTATDSAGVTKVGFFVDGAPYDVDSVPPWEFAWDNRGLPEGDYVLAVKAYDAAGNSATDQRTVRLRDLVLVTGIEVTNTRDPVLAPYLEVEIHLYDADDATYLGCSGEKSGLGGVEGSDLRYATQAYFTTPAPSEDVVLLDDIAQRNLKIVVIEDDIAPCPESQPGAADDLIGTYEPLPVSDLTRVLSFDNVVYLVFGTGRRG